MNTANKKGALEMSIGTIVIMVIAITMLIFGIIFVRSVMCAGIIMTDKINEGMKGKIIELFGADDYGVKCMGEGGELTKLGSGGKRPVVCVIKSDENVEYNLSLKEIKSLPGGASDSAVKDWVIDSGWKGSVSPGGKGTAVVAVLLNIPRDAPSTTLKITMEATNLKSSTKTNPVSRVDIVPSGFFTSTMC